MRPGKLTPEQRRAILDSVVRTVNRLWLHRESENPPPDMRETPAEIASELPPDLRENHKARAEAFKLARERWRALFDAHRAHRSGLRGTTSGPSSGH